LKENPSYPILIIDIAARRSYLMPYILLWIQRVKKGEAISFLVYAQAISKWVCSHLSSFNLNSNKYSLNIIRKQVFKHMSQWG